jgi:hypothetical protein
MKKSTSGSEPNIILTCLEDAQCTIYFEPWGNDCVLKHDEVFHVFSSAFATGDVEVSHVRGGISLAFTGNAPVTVTDQAGRVFLVL